MSEVYLAKRSGVYQFSHFTSSERVPQFWQERYRRLVVMYEPFFFFRMLNDDFVLILSI